MASYSSAQIIAQDAEPRGKVSTRKWRGRAYIVVDFIEKAAQADTNGVLRLFRIRSGDVLAKLELWNDAVAGLTSISVGVYRTARNGGAVVSTSALTAVGQTLATANLGNVLHLSTITRTYFGRPIWEVVNATETLGWTEDPKQEWDVAIVIVTDGTAGGTLNFYAQMLMGS